MNLGIIAGVVAAVVVFAYILKTRKTRKAAKAAARLNKIRKEEVNKKVEEMKLREERAMKQAEEIRQKREEEIAAAIKKAPGSESLRLASMQTEANAKVLTITEFKAAAKAGYVVFDTETTGLSSVNDAIAEIAAVRVEGNEIVAEYHTMVDPERSMPAAASAVNHITDDMLKGQPKIHEVLPGFLTFVGDSVLVAHNATFDAQFVAQACIRNRFKAPERYFDTMSFARYYPEAENKKQETLLRCAGITNEQAHRALGDARALAQFVIVCLNRKKSKQGE